MGLIGFVAAWWLISFGPVEFDFWTAIGLYLFAAGATLR